jgi:ABC-2 type transport system ATP-binding protein
VWAFDFQFDVTDDGRAVKLLYVVDEFTREALAMEAERRSTPTRWSTCSTGSSASAAGHPEFVRCDNGPEMTSNALRTGAGSPGPGRRSSSPARRGRTRSWSRSTAASATSSSAVEVFTCLAEAKVMVEDFRQDYNRCRPHRAHGMMTPAAFKTGWETAHEAAPASAELHRSLRPRSVRRRRQPYPEGTNQPPALTAGGPMNGVRSDGLTFEVPPGVVTGFLGPNGSGKSTTMRMILGLDAPNSGTALINGKHFSELAWPLREVGSLLDAKAFHPARSARNHLRQLALANDIPSKRVDEVLDQVGLTAVANRRAGKFSLGMGQRLGIAAALLGDPGVLLFDEPVNGLDPEGIRWVRDLLKSLAAEGRTVFVSSHLISEMALTADRFIVIGRGRLIAETTVAEFTARSNSASVKLLTPDAGEFTQALLAAGANVTSSESGALTVTGLEASEIGDLAAHKRLRVHELSPITASLEDAFMELTKDEVEYRPTELLAA